MNGAAGRLMTKEERKRLEEAIDKSESLEGESDRCQWWETPYTMRCAHASPRTILRLTEIRRLEERLRLGYAIEDPSSTASKKGKK